MLLVEHQEFLQERHLRPTESLLELGLKGKKGGLEMALIQGAGACNHGVAMGTVQIVAATRMGH